MRAIRRGFQKTTAAGLATITAMACTIGLATSPVGATGTVDQRQEVVTDLCHEGEPFGQTFTAGRTGNLDQIDLVFLKRPDRTSPFTVEVRTVGGGVPTATVLASATVPAASVGPADPSGWPGGPSPIDNPPRWVSVPIGPVAVAAGTQYAFVVLDEGIECPIGNIDDDFYPGGDWITSDFGGPFEARPGKDLSFRTYVSPFPTTLVANPSIVKLSGLKLYLTLSARLMSSGSGVAGRTVSFSAGNKAVCSALTNANGDAACGGLIPGTLASVLGLGYTATFVGDSTYAASSAAGPLIG
jgi:hypothetical protein